MTNQQNMLTTPNNLLPTVTNSNYNNQIPAQHTSNQQNAHATHNKLPQTDPNPNYSNKTSVQPTCYP